MNNWLGIKGPNIDPTDAQFMERCGAYVPPSDDMPYGSTEYMDLVESRLQCIYSVYDMARAETSQLQEKVDMAVMAGTVILPIIFLLCAKMIFRALDRVMVNSAAGAIRAKRSVGAYKRDVQQRISEKVDTERSD